MKLKAPLYLLTLLAATAIAAATAPEASAADRVFELRTYTASPGKLDALDARFRDHTIALFKKHGMEVVGFWEPVDKEAGAGEKLIYLLAHPSREAAPGQLEGLPRGSGVGQGQGRVRGWRCAARQDRECLPRGDGLLASEVDPHKRSRSSQS